MKILFIREGTDLVLTTVLVAFATTILTIFVLVVAFVGFALFAFRGIDG